MLVSSLLALTAATAVAAHGSGHPQKHAAAARRMRDSEPELDLRSEPKLQKRSFSGRGTWYDVEERICACGDWHKNSEHVVAMSEYHRAAVFCSSSLSRSLASARRILFH